MRFGCSIKPLSLIRIAHGVCRPKFKLCAVTFQDSFDILNRPLADAVKVLPTL
jgi:hypothetical protein